MFKELYSKRWKVETFYDDLKNKLKIKYFTGYSTQSIYQDFYCAILISSSQTAVINSIQQELAEQNKEKEYAYKINTNLSYSFLKNRVLDLLCSVNDIEAEFNTAYRQKPDFAECRKLKSNKILNNGKDAPKKTNST